MKRYSWRDTLTVSLVSLKVSPILSKFLKKGSLNNSSIGRAPNNLHRDMFKPFRFLIEVCSVDLLVACVKICTGFKGGSF